jgi:hypothetical protein
LRVASSPLLSDNALSSTFSFLLISLSF